MKRILILFAFSISEIGALVQNVEALLRKYKSEKNVEYVHIKRFIILMVKMLRKARQAYVNALNAIFSIRVRILE